MFELLAKFSKLRTSTKAGLAGVVPAVLVLLPFYDQVEAFLQQACTSENGVFVFLVGSGLTWVTMLVAARASKTPANPGLL